MTCISTVLYYFSYVLSLALVGWPYSIRCRFPNNRTSTIKF